MKVRVRHMTVTFHRKFTWQKPFQTGQKWNHAVKQPWKNCTTHRHYICRKHRPLKPPYAYLSWVQTTTIWLMVMQWRIQGLKVSRNSDDIFQQDLGGSKELKWWFSLSLDLIWICISLYSRMCHVCHVFEFEFEFFWINHIKIVRFWSFFLGNQSHLLDRWLCASTYCSKINSDSRLRLSDGTEAARKTNTLHFDFVTSVSENTHSNLWWSLSIESLQKQQQITVSVDILPNLLSPQVPFVSQN